MPRYEEILALFKRHGQEHVLAGWDKLFMDQQDELLEDCARVDFRWVAERWKEYESRQDSAVAASADIVPAPVVELPATDAEKTRERAALQAGEELLRQGKVAAFLVAGGQGTRLGFEGPKGCFPIGPVSGRTLFAWHAEQILARSKRYGVAIPWYIMTSCQNDRDTRQFFEEHNHFGLNKRDVFFFQQEMVPCLDLYGKLMLSSPSTLAMNPNGHGGSLHGLLHSGALKNMRERGIEVISYFQVDNPLVTICDPVFLGLHTMAGAEMSSKVLKKNIPSERIGVVCLRGGTPCVIEYMDMDEESMRAVDANGRLRFWAGSIAIHMINVDFVERVAQGPGLPWHQSLKKVPYFAGNRLIKPDAENAIKFETFVFDALPFTKSTVNMEVCREREFAPVKNAEGTDSVASSRLLLSNYFCEWLAGAGISVPVPELSALAKDAARPVVEISPLYSLDGEELARKIKPEGFTLERVLLIG